MLTEICQYPLFKKGIFKGIFFYFGPKTAPKHKINGQNSKNHISSLCSIIFIIKNLLFDVDIFSQTLDME